MSRELYRAVIGHFATGVSVISGADDDGPVGMTVNALCSLSLQPLLVLACFDNDSRTLRVVRETGRFGVSILRYDQDQLAQRFASKHDERRKFDGVEHELREGVPVVSGALAWLACELREWHPGGDHAIAVGAVAAMDHTRDADEPLVWYRGRYTSVSHRRSSAAPPLL